MNTISTAELRAVIQGDWHLEHDVTICGVSEPESAGKQDLVYAVTPEHLKKIKQCAFAIVPEGDWDLSFPHVRTKNPYYSFALTLQLMCPHEPTQAGHSSRAFIHPEADVDHSAILYPGVFVDAGVKIGAHSVLYPNVFIGKNSTVGANCILYPSVTIMASCALGNRVIIQPNSVIGGEGFGFAPDRGVHHKIPQVGGVIIEDDVEIGANVCIDSGTIRPTRIGAGTKVDNLVQLAHNVETGNGCLFVAQSGVSGSTRLGNHVTFAGQSGAVGHVEVGDRSLIYARGVVTSNIPADSKISGFPGRDHKEDMKFQAALRKVPKLREAIREIVKYLKLDLKV